MLLRFLPLFSATFLCVPAQKVIKLSSLKGGNVKNTIDLTPPYAVAVSAQSDDSSLLQQIFLETQDGQSNSMKALKDRKPSSNSGLLDPYAVSTPAYLSTPLTNSQLSSLTGFMYIMTKKQSDAAAFSVYDVDKSQVIQIDRNINGNSTIVFLNSNQQTAPSSSSTISAWLQSEDSGVKLYKGIPTDDAEMESTQIFSNPVQMLKKDQFVFFPTVEKFSLSMETFYIKTYNDIRFTIEPLYFDIDLTGTSSYHSTGFYMKSNGQYPKKVSVLCVRDTRYNGTTGANINGNLPLPTGTVTVQENDAGQSNSMTVAPVDGILAWRTYAIGQNITISSKDSQGGEFFVQYYVSQGQQISSTVSSTTSTPQTTTKTSSLLGVFLAFLTALTASVL